ncbi:hypothetical protein [Bdellovibrio sp. HCB337]|uniref:hypothetical protein n=1 Tax=Bdellovibrio sp. HCB337 TaxID=3394358 RepID=UPI0039A4D047
MDKARFKRRLENVLPLRLHMSVICFLTIAGGVLFSKALLYFSFSHMALRYGFAVLFSYGVFFGLVYLWLRWYFGSPSTSSDGNFVDVIDLADAPSRIDIPPPQWSGQGGQFSGGGASGSWGSGSSSSSSSGADLDLDDGMVIILLLAFIAMISGSAIYLVYQAPEILLEAGFEVLLVAGVVRNAKRMQAEGWAYSIFKRTWVAFGLVLLIAVLFGMGIKHECPQAISFADYRALCWDSKQLDWLFK